MPELLVEFFVKFLTDPADVVFDPFAGSNTTGSVAERLGRSWIGIEADAEYAAVVAGAVPGGEEGGVSLVRAIPRASRGSDRTVTRGNRAGWPGR